MSVVIEPPDSSEQQVYFGTRDWGWYDELGGVECPIIYERLQMQAPGGAQARIMHAWGSAGSGEVELAFKVSAKNQE